MSTQNGTGNIFDRAVIISVGLTRLGTRRKVASGAVEIETDKSMIHVSKDILESQELQDIEKLDGEIRRYIQLKCLPSPLKSGCYMLPIPLVEIVDRRLEEFFAQRTTLVEIFLTAYPAKVEDAQRRLGPKLFNPMDYPPLERVRAAFGASSQYLTFGIPGSLESISRSIFARETEKAQARIAVVEDEITQVLRLTLKDLVDHMVSRLAPGEGGKPKIFKNSLVANMTEFLGTFKARNLTNDEELDVLVEQAKGILNGVNPQALRDNTSIRTYVQTEMAKIKGALDTMVMNKPTRQISFEDADAA